MLAELVRTRSQNPIDGEAAIAETVARLLAPTAAEVHVVELAPGRPSVAAVLRGSSRGPRLVLNGHMDTVPAGDATAWSVDPFSADVVDGCLYGRGACDMKAGLAAQIGVAHALSAHRSRMRGDLVLHFAAGEETAEAGTLSLLQAGFGGDVGITTEPTSLRVATAQRGAAYFRVHVRGRMAHAGRPELGVNTIELLPRVLEALGRYRADIDARVHPVLGRGTCTPTVVRAGEKDNVIPDACEVRIDRRLLPSESPGEELASLRSVLHDALGDDVSVDLLPRLFEASETAVGSSFAELVRTAVTRVTGATEAFWGTPYASDVRNLIRDAGMDAVTFGPGDIDHAHAIDERVPLDEVRAAALVLTDVATEVLLET